MPIYDYLCPNCTKITEIITSADDVNIYACRPCAYSEGSRVSILKRQTPVPAMITQKIAEVESRRE